MARASSPPHPVVQRTLRGLGESIHLARLRRRLSASLVAERAGMSRTTLAAIEKGSANVTIGAYANVLHALGLHGDLAVVARDDELGRRLQDARLPARGSPVPRRARKK